MAPSVLEWTSATTLERASAKRIITNGCLPLFQLQLFCLLAFLTHGPFGLMILMTRAVRIIGVGGHFRSLKLRHFETTYLGKCVEA